MGREGKETGFISEQDNFRMLITRTPHGISWCFLATFGKIQKKTLKMNNQQRLDHGIIW